MHAESATPVDSIRDALEGGEPAVAARIYAEVDLDPAGVRRLFDLVSPAMSAELVSLLSDEKASELLSWLPAEQATAVLEQLPVPVAARVLRGLPSDERADLLASVPDQARSEIQESLPELIRDDAARLLKYAPDTAGGLMETEVLAFPASTKISEVIRDVRANQMRYSTIGVQYLYVLDDERRLLGVAPIRDLLLAPEESRLDALLRGEPATVRDTATMQEVDDLFAEYGYQGLPVVDERGVLLGVVSRADVTEAEHHQSEERYRVSQGIVGGEELRSMPVLLRLRRRTAWLGVNLVLCLGGAAVIALNQGTIAKALVVVAVLPIISATSGNAAIQAAAVSIRELTLGIIDPSAWRRVLAREVLLAILMSLPLGLAVAILARLGGADGAVGAAVGVAMAGNSLVAVGLGALCPLALRRLGVDPALASGPIITTLADVTGFTMTLGLVSWVAA
ncbi:MAG: magnesium transporter [Phycisphaeraceae bacterium]|nr:magnesium transporter [Phycisphaeraceae bacterium]